MADNTRRPELAGLAAVHAAAELAATASTPLCSVALLLPDKFGVAASLPQYRLPLRLPPSWLPVPTIDGWTSGLRLVGLTAGRRLRGQVPFGEAGHINTESGFRGLASGVALFQRLRRHAQSKSVGSAHSICVGSRPGAWKLDGRKSEAAEGRRRDVRRQLAASPWFGWVARIGWWVVNKLFTAKRDGDHCRNLMMKDVSQSE